MTVTRFARRHPRASKSAALFAARHWRGVRDVAGVSQKAMQQSRAVVGGVTEPKLRHEVRSAFAELSAAVDRGRRVGIENALTDKKVTSHLTRAGDHASGVWNGLATAWEKPAKKRRRRLLGLGVLGAVLLGGLWRAVWPRSAA
ncbi:MAG TPA: hypothetical protein VG652_06055 [Gaiellaceae bacterium]|nr:hypothetical protein [Gaiellaceae bacterium]